MAAAPSLSFGLNFGQFRVSTVGNDEGLTTLQSDGLHLESGLEVYTGLAATGLNTANIVHYFDGAPVYDYPLRDAINGLEGYPAHTLTVATAHNLSLVAGEKLVIDYDYIPYDYRFNDFAFSVLKYPDGTLIPDLMGDVDHYTANNSYPTHFTITYPISQTGSFDLMFGSSDAGDTLEPSDLIIHSVSIQVPVGGYTIQGNGVLLGDGTLLQSDGSALSPGGVLEPSVLSGSSANLVSALSSDETSGLISQDGNGLISQDGNGLISQDGNGLVSPIISQDGNGLISQDGNGIVSTGAGNLVGANATSLLATNGGGIVGGNEFHTLSLDEQGLLPRTYTTVIPTPPTFDAAAALLTGPAMTGTAALVSEGATGVRPSAPSIAALTNGTFAIAWQNFLGGAIANSSYDDVQLFSADGVALGQPIDFTGQAVFQAQPPHVTALAGGGFVVALDADTAATQGSVQISNVQATIFDAAGNVLQTIASAPPVDFSNQQDQGVVTGLPDGTFQLTWAKYDASNGSTSGQTVAHYSATGQLLSQTSEGAGPVSAQAALHDGSVVSVYTVPMTASTSGPGVVVQIISASGVLTNRSIGVIPEAADPNTVTLDDTPAVATLTSGNFVVAWFNQGDPTSQDATAQGASVRAQIFTSAGAPVGNTFTVTTLTSRYFGPPAIAPLADGRFVISWESDGSNEQVTAQAYNVDGSLSGAQFLGNSAVFSNEPAMATLSDGTLEIASYDSQNGVAEVRVEPVTFDNVAASLLQGRAVDGYISGATVFADANGDGLLSPGEASATTDSLGRYSFSTPASGTIILTGGTDISTGLAFTETLTAPAGSLTVTPLTTLIQKVDAAKGGNLQSAELQVNAEFGFSAATDLTALDPVRATNAGSSDGATAFVDGAIVADTVALAIAAGATGDVYGTFALQIAANPTGFDVTSVAAMQALGLTGTAAADISALAQASKALLTQAQTTDTANAQALLLTGAAIEKVAQGATSQALTAAAATQSFDPVVSAYTGTALANAVAGSPTSTVGGGGGGTTTMPGGGGTPTLTGGGATATTDTVLGGDNVIRSIPFGTAALATLAAPLLAGTTPSTTLPIDAAGTYAMTSAHTAAVIAATGAVTLIGNAASNETIAAGAGAFAFQAGTGGGTLIAGSGADSIYLPGGGNWNIALGNGADTVVAVTGNNTVSTGTGGSFVFLGSGTASIASAGTDTILGSTGAATVLATGTAADEVFALGGPLSFIAGAGASTVVAGSVAATLFGGATGTLMFGNGATQVLGAAGADTVVGLGGSLSVQGGAGGGLFFGGAAGGNAITAGAGNAVAFGGGAGDVLTATGSASDLFAGGVGAETLTGAGSTGQNTFFAGFGPETLIGGDGNTALVAGAGADLLVGGSGLTLFLFVNGRTIGAADTISGFDPTHDFVKLAGYAGDEATVVARAKVVAGSSVIALSDGTSITFAGVTTLNAGSFT